MALAIIDNVRRAVVQGQPLRQSDVLALCSTAEHLWRGTVSRGHGVGSQARRDYMRAYMRHYRQAKRDKLVTSQLPSAMP